jgi:hypothetical protein
MLEPKNGDGLSRLRFALVVVALILAIAWVWQRAAASGSSWDALPAAADAPQASRGRDADEKEGNLASRVDLVRESHGILINIVDAVTSAPLPDAVVQCQSRREKADNRGMVLVPWSSGKMTVLCPGYVPKLVDAEGHALGAKEVTVALLRGCRVEGVVTDAGGRPVGGVTVTLSAQGLDGGSRLGSDGFWSGEGGRVIYRQSTTTDRLGQYCFGSVAAGKHRLCAHGGGWVALFDSPHGHVGVGDLHVAPQAKLTMNLSVRRILVARLWVANHSALSKEVARSLVRVGFNTPQGIMELPAHVSTPDCKGGAGLHEEGWLVEQFGLEMQDSDTAGHGAAMARVVKRGAEPRLVEVSWLPVLKSSPESFSRFTFEDEQALGAVRLDADVTSVLENVSNGAPGELYPVPAGSGIVEWSVPAGTYVLRPALGFVAREGREVRVVVGQGASAVGRLHLRQQIGVLRVSVTDANGERCGGYVVQVRGSGVTGCGQPKAEDSGFVAECDPGNYQVAVTDWGGRVLAQREVAVIAGQEVAWDVPMEGM